MQNGRSADITYPLNSGRRGGQMFEALPPSESYPGALLNTRTRSCGFGVPFLCKKRRVDRSRPTSRSQRAALEEPYESPGLLRRSRRRGSRSADLRPRWIPFPLTCSPGVTLQQWHHQSIARGWPSREAVKISRERGTTDHRKAAGVCLGCVLVRLEGLEPPTPSSGNWCSIR